jgi:hypothetical protein
MNYASWRPIFQAMCPEPGPRDMFVVVLINGKRVGFDHIEAHPKLCAAGQKLATEHKCQVKVLPMNGHELMTFLGIELGPGQPIEPMDPAFRAQAIKNCMDALRECDDVRLREDALIMLKALGALNEQ